MVLAKPAKKVEYKETSVFELFPVFEYTRRQRSRIILHHCYAKNIVKTIRYAANFDVPNKLSLIWCVGQPPEERIGRALADADASTNVCVLTSEWRDDWQRIYEQYDNLRKHCIGAGTWDKEHDMPNEHLYHHLKACLHWDEIDGTDTHRREYESTITTIHDYQALKCRCGKTIFKRFTCYRRGLLPKPFTYDRDRLNALICKVFSSGTEAIGISDNAAITPAGILRGINAVNCNDQKKLDTLQINDHNPAVQAIRKLLNKKFRDQAPCSLAELKHIMTSPPLGLLPCEYSAACFAYALKHYSDRRLLFWDTLTTWDCWRDGDLVSAMMNYLFPLGTSRYNNRRTAKDCYLFIESKPHKQIKKLIHEIFEIPMMVPSIMMFQRFRRQLENEHRLPLASIDNRLYRILDCSFYWWDSQRLSDLYTDISTDINDLKKSYHQYIRADAEIPKENGTMYSQAAPWLWTEEVAKRNTVDFEISDGTIVKIKQPGVMNYGALPMVR